MLIMFAVGVMSLLGMALITLLILLEKVVPARNMLIPRAGGPILMGWGVWLLAVA
jgi:predicted metal-binding membrane protein